MKQALVRPPGASFVRAISSQRLPIDVQLAQAQHREYCEALATAGLAVEALPPDERYPDGCFVQDPAMVIEGLAIICRLGASSRRGEESAIAGALAGRFPLAHIAAPGTLEGGDVLRLPGKVLVGRSERTNDAGIAQLSTLLAPAGLAVDAVPVREWLHLLSAATYLGHDTLLAVEGFDEHPAFGGLDVLVVPREEAGAGNALGLGECVVLPAGYGRVAAMLCAHGFTVLQVPISEFAKADGGVTCLSLVWGSREVDK